MNLTSTQPNQQQAPLPEKYTRWRITAFNWHRSIDSLLGLICLAAIGGLFYSTLQSLPTSTLSYRLLWLFSLLLFTIAAFSTLEILRGKPFLYGRFCRHLLKHNDPVRVITPDKLATVHGRYLSLPTEKLQPYLASLKRKPLSFSAYPIKDYRESGLAYIELENGAYAEVPFKAIVAIGQ